MNYLTGGSDLDIAIHLTGYRYWTRIAMLRGLVRYLEAEGVTDAATLRTWAERTDFESGFQGRVPGLGIASFQWLTMRAGRDGLKADVHLTNFVQRASGRRLKEPEVVAVLERVARELGLTGAQLDARIWRAERERYLSGRLKAEGKHAKENGGGKRKKARR